MQFAGPFRGGAEPSSASVMELPRVISRAAFDVDVLAFPHCGGRLRLIAPIEATATTQRTLRHLGLPTEIPTPRAARTPPSGDGDA